MVHGNNCPEKYITFDGRCTTCGEQLFYEQQIHWARDERGVERPKFATGGIVTGISYSPWADSCPRPVEEIVPLSTLARVAELERQVKQLRAALADAHGALDEGGLALARRSGDIPVVMQMGEVRDRIGALLEATEPDDE